MNIKTLSNPRGFAGLLSIIASVVIIAILVFFMLKAYTGSRVVNKDTNRALFEQGIDTTNSKTIVDSTRAAVNEVQKKQEQQLKEIDDFANLPGQ